MVFYRKTSVLREPTHRVVQVLCVAIGFLLTASGVDAAGIDRQRSFKRNLPVFSHVDTTHNSNAKVSTQSHAEPNVDAAPALEAESSAMNLFVSSGLKELVGHIPPSTASSFEVALTANQLPGLFMAVDREALKKAVNNAFKVETFHNYLVKELHSGMSAQSREFMLGWYSSPLGVRVKQAELDNSLLTEQARFDNYQVFLKHFPAEAKRLDLIKNLDITLKSTESALDMMSSIQVAFNLSLTRFMPEEQRLSRNQIQRLVAQNQKELFTHYEKKTKDVLLFTYQSLNNEDLMLLNNALATNAGQEFVVAINNGIKKGMFAASLDLGDGLGALLEVLPGNSGI